MLLAEGLHHAFGRVVALDGVSFSLAPGQTLAIFGPNGAGKTTLLKVLAGLINPQAGSARVDGGRRAIGWIGHQSHLYGHLTVRENLLFWGSLYGLSAARRAARAAEVLARLDMSDRAGEPVWSLSLARAAEVLARLDMSDRAGEPVWSLSRGLLQRAAIA